MSRPAVSSALGARAVQAGPSRNRPRPIHPSAPTSIPHSPRPPPRDPPKPIKYTRAPPGIVQIPHPALDPSLGSTRLYVQITNVPLPSLVHLFAVSRAVEAYFKTPIVTVDANMNPELVSPYTALYITLLRPVKLDKPLTLLTRQPRISAKDTDIYGPSLQDIRSVLDSTAEAENVFGNPGPLAGLEKAGTLQFQVSPSSVPLPRRDQQKEQTMDYLPKRLQDQRKRMRQEKQAEDMKIYAVVEQLARSSQGEFDNVLSKFRHLKPAAGPDAERVAKELALLRHREMEEQAPIPGWAFTLGQQEAQAGTADAKESGNKAETSKAGFSLSALSSSMSSAEEARDPAPLKTVSPPTKDDSSTLVSSDTTAETKSPGKVKSPRASLNQKSPALVSRESRPIDTSHPPKHPQQAPTSEIEPFDSSSSSTKDSVKVDKMASIALQLARKKEQDRLDAEARAQRQREIQREVDELGAQAAREREEQARAGWLGAIKGLLKGK